MKKSFEKFFGGRSAVGKIVKTLTDKNSYHYLDLYRSSLALKGYDFAYQHKLESITPEIVDGFHSELERLSQDQLAYYVQECVHRQVKVIFARLHKQLENKPKSRLEMLKIQESNKSNEEAVDRYALPFKLECKESKIPNAGQGVFIRAMDKSQPIIPPGTVVALYPGLVHLREHLRDRNYLMSLLPDPDLLLMTRIDQTIIDGRTADKCYPNPYALGHKINHCGKNRPNVLQVPFDFREDLIFDGNSFPVPLRYLIPNGFAKPPSMIGKLELATVHMKSMVFIATAPLEDNDELIMDYRLNPRMENLPSWYESYNTEEAKMRWTDDEDSSKEEEEK